MGNISLSKMLTKELKSNENNLIRLNSVVLDKETEKLMINKKY